MLPRRGGSALAQGGRALMLNAHLDTVGVAGMERPHEPRVEDGRLYGRGALDTKGGLAACMVAAATPSGETPPWGDGRRPRRGFVVTPGEVVPAILHSIIWPSPAAPVSEA